MRKSEETGQYPDVEPQPKLPEIERRVLSYWEREGIFRESIENRPAGPQGQNEFVFYDGPPFANGLPHYGHLITSYIKDIVPRYQTLRGRRVERRFGWDCHGLPAEMEAERELGVAGRSAIQAFGIAKFNEHARSSVLKYTREWKEYIDRAARWVDFDNSYRTLDLPYMESVIWCFKQLWERGLVYEGYRVMPYSWAAQTPLSNFETRQDDAYRERTDPAVTVRFTLEPEPGDEGPLDLLVWTTTPWTLPSNLALAVGGDIDYSVLELQGRRVVLASALVASYANELENSREVGSLKGSKLAGRRYAPLFSFFADTPRAFRVIAADFVETGEGTGIVHLAPGFGEIDQEVCEAEGIPLKCPVDDSGSFTSEIEPWVGINVIAANPAIVDALREQGKLFRHERYTHNYPHCWRTDEPLIYRALNSWYVKVSAFRHRMVELNRQIEWTPAHVGEGLFGNWLEGARDWSITRNRFWGTPIPVWRSDDPRFPRTDVYGSLDEIERDFGVRPTDLHRPYIDELTRPNPDDPSGNSRMRRVPDVLDVWFDSGAMPFAQWHYPFENQQWFDQHFPADFITEYTGQTRGWFYTLMVLATALFDRPPFKRCLAHGMILDENGKKLSKRLRNYPDPREVFESLGSDAMRWYLVSSPVMKGGEIRIDRHGAGIVEVVRLVLYPIWNAYHFFCLYGNSDRIAARRCRPAECANPLDRYMGARIRQLIEGVQTSMDELMLVNACAHVASFVDGLTNWYIRRSRQRFWKEELDRDKQDAYDVLYTALTVLCRVMSPLLPLLAEEIYRGLTRERSVHLCDWPDFEDFSRDDALVMDMERVREVCSAGLALRSASEVRVRQPLASLTVAGRSVERLAQYRDLIEDEVNVKAVHCVEGAVEDFTVSSLVVNARALGPRLGAATKEVIAASKRGEWRRLESGELEVAGEVLREGEFELRLRPRDGVACQVLSGCDAVVTLDLSLSEDLLREGRARDVVRAVQQVRKSAGLHVSDRIRLALQLSDDWCDAAVHFRDYISTQTLATELSFEGPGDAEVAGWFTEDVIVAGEKISVRLHRAT